LPGEARSRAAFDALMPGNDAARPVGRPLPNSDLTRQLRQLRYQLLELGLRPNATGARAHVSLRTDRKQAPLVPARGGRLCDPRLNCGSIGADVRVVDDFAPFRDLSLDAGAELLGSIGDGSKAQCL
jgi:hypothetical protein